MLDSEDRRWIFQHAYLPEHLPDYVLAISGAKAYLHDNYLCFIRNNHLTFIGYPLGDSSRGLPEAYTAVCERFQPSTVALIAPNIWLAPETYEKQPQDSYYRLDLPLKTLHPGVVYMIRRAERELQVAYGEYGREHRRMVKGFISRHKLTSDQKRVFKHLPYYLKDSKSARLIEARKGTQLAAFTITDMGSADYAFYMFNFRSKKETVPGASDMLFNEMVRLARFEGKKAINLGLGIHAGIRRFKEKWGGVPFLSYAAGLVHRKPVGLGRLTNKL